MTLATENFTYVADLVRQRSAIQLGPGKEYLVESRLMPLARKEGLTEVDDYVRRVRRAGTPSDLELVVEALTTNETSWFRDQAPFTALAQEILPRLEEDNGGPLPSLRVWSAACSTGQEPYSIAMVLADALRGSPTDVRILATDLSGEVLDRARAGTYSQLEMNRGLPATQLVRHFARAGAGWQVSPELQRVTTFRRHNLLDPAPGGPFHVVFLRNVLIYFDTGTKAAILRRVRQAIRPGGFLVLGAAETTVGVDSAWERVPTGRGAVYRPLPGGVP